MLPDKQFFYFAFFLTLLLFIVQTFNYKFLIFQLSNASYCKFDVL